MARPKIIEGSHLRRVTAGIPHLASTIRYRRGHRMIGSAIGFLRWHALPPFHGRYYGESFTGVPTRRYGRPTAFIFFSSRRRHTRYSSDGLRGQRYPTRGNIIPP